MGMGSEEIDHGSARNSTEGEGEGGTRASDEELAVDAHNTFNGASALQITSIGQAIFAESWMSVIAAVRARVEAQIAEFTQGQPGGERPPTLVFSSHNLGQVKRLASRVIYLEQGQVLADAPVHDFFNRPLPPAAAQFLKGELG